MLTEESHFESEPEYSQPASTVNPVSQGPEGGPDVSRTGSSREKKLALLALLLLVPAPSVGVMLAMVIDSTQGTMIGKGAYFLSKAWILALPVLWLLWVEKKRLGISRPERGGLLMGAGLGLGISAIIFAAYLLIGDRIIDPQTLKDAAIANGIGRPILYIPFVAYLTIVNSLLEEYVWRWFVFRQCERLVGGGGAVICSAAFFTIHHVFALKAQAGWPITLLGSTGVFIGGAVWSWCYLKYKSIWPGYISHIIVDAAIFVIGWLLIFG